jgi:glycosyltransferase involved in cell wall biosynthesis
MIPSYNCIHYLRKTIESVLAQALDPQQMQIEVIDDFSTDGNVKALVEKLGKGRIGFYKQPHNVGSLRNFETCINRSKGKFVHILHGDDLVRPGFYNEIGKLFKKFPNAGAAFTNCTGIDDNSISLWDCPEILSESGIIDNFLLKLAEGQLLQTPSIVVKREVYEKLGSFFGVHYGEDWEMWARIAANYDVAYSPKPLAYYRVHTDNITGNSYATGDNIKDVISVINTIQNYLPAEHRKSLKKMAKKKYAYSIIGRTDQLYSIDKHKTVLLQLWKAFQLYPDKHMFYYLVKISVRLLVRYKKSG